MVNDGSHSYTYDAENRITQVDGGATATYVYDANGQRVRKLSGGVKIDYAYNSDGNVSGELWTPPGYFTVGYIYLNRQLVAEYKDSTTYFVHKDHLGSTRLLTRLDQTVCDSMDYLPFGEQISGDACTTHKFTGKERDSESGLDNFGARFDSSSLGRFMSPDWSANPEPIPYAKLDNPQSLNLYSYVDNNPVSRTDIDGHCWKSFFGEKLCNWFDWGHFVDDTHLNAALQKDADQARADIARTKNMTFNGQSPQDYAKGLNNQQAILAQRALVQILAGMAITNLQNPCGHTGTDMKCGVVIPLGLGSTGRTVAADLREQLAMEEVMADPKGTKTGVQMNDQRWHRSQGWVKMSQTVNGVEIHWVENTITGAVDDFKFAK